MLMVIVHFGLADSIYEEVFQFCRQNGYQYISIIDPQKMILNDSKYAFNESLRLRLSHNIEDNFSLMNVDMVIFAFIEMKNINQVLNIIEQRRIKRSLFIISNNRYNAFIDAAQELKKNSFFYVSLYDGGTITKWMQIITMNYSPQVIANELIFDNSGQIIEKYNLQGYEIVATGLSWAPYNIHNDCNELGRSCTNSGFLVDMMNIWSLQFNFTWDIYADVNGLWGEKPVSGKQNRLLERSQYLS